MRRFAPPVLALAATLSCAGPYAERPPASGTDRRTPPEASTPAETAARAPAGSSSGGTVIGHVTPDGRLDADTLAEAPDPDPVDRETVVTGHIRSSAGAGEPGPVVAPEPPAGAPGWRIQVFAAADEATADGVARRAGDAAPGVPVYVEAEGSWFKVRLGDFATREAAEPLRERMVALGWSEAWVVRTRVLAPR